jgi:hypothetical protein
VSSVFKVIGQFWLVAICVNLCSSAVDESF